MTPRLELTKAQRRLAVIWFLGGGVTFVILISMSLAGSFGGQTPKAWSWFLPNIVPTLSLIIGALVYDAARTPPEGATVDGTLYSLSWALSLFYLLMLLGTLLARAPLTRFSPIEVMQVSTLYMVPLQGLVGAALAAFFVSRKD